MIKRAIEPVLRDLFTKYPVVTVTGPRQSGKTTLCRYTFPDLPYVNLESPDTRQFAKEDPRAFIKQYEEGVIIDEIQRAPDLLSYIQVIVDDRKRAGQFLLTGSQQFEVSNTISQSLAGRTALLRLLPLSISELKGAQGKINNVNELIYQGFYPAIYDRDLNPTQAMGDYFITYVERDIRQLVAVKDLSLFEKFVRLCAGRVGQILNVQSLGNDAGVSHTTARAWISLLEASYVIFLLPPWFGNISKRLIKSPKLYFYDVGLASFLLGLQNENHASRDPLRGNLFENLVVMEVLKYLYNRGRYSNLTFYRDSSGNEVDLLLQIGPDIFPLEIKSGETVTADSIKSLKNISRIFPDLPQGSGLIYGGAEKQIRTGMKIYPFSSIELLLRERMEI